MASSQSNSCNIKGINETLYSDYYFDLKKLKNNTPKAKNEFRNLICQTEMHCSFLNMDKDSKEEILSKFILEYSSIVDKENHEGLLPFVEDHFNLENYFENSLDLNSELEEVHRCYMKVVEKGLNSREKIEKCKSRKTKSKNNGTNVSDTSINKSYHFHEQSANPFAENSLKRRGKNKIKIIPDEKSGSCQTRSKNNRQTRSKDNGINVSDASINKSCHLHQQSANPIAENSHKRRGKKQSNYSNDTESQNTLKNSLKDHPTLKNLGSKIVDVILSEIIDFNPGVTWRDIAGLELVKSTVQEIVIWPLLRPDIFTGLRAPPKGILLFGPPGTGKTMIGKCIATESNSYFFCISASSLLSKWIGESEKLVRALFAVAELHQPAVIFFDEIDSLLSQRNDEDSDHTRKIKTEFLVQFDGAKTNSERRILVVGATNRPHDLDEAARRRFAKRLYVPLPEKASRLQIIENLLANHRHVLSTENLTWICEETDGYSGSDVAHLCKEAAMGPIRSIGPEQIKTVSLDQVRPIELVDFIDALKQIRPSVTQEDLIHHLDWNKKFGSFSQ